MKPRCLDWQAAGGCLRRAVGPIKKKMQIQYIYIYTHVYMEMTQGYVGTMEKKVETTIEEAGLRDYIGNS